MHLIITDAWLAKSRAVHLSGTRLVLSAMVLSLTLMLVAAGVVHLVFLKNAPDGRLTLGATQQLEVPDDSVQRDKIMRANLDVLARQLGEVQAKLTQLESLGERVSGLAGINASNIRAKPAQGGALVTGRPLSIDELQATLSDLDRITAQRTDLMTVLESRLFDQKMRNLMVPTQKPVFDANVGSDFGWRIDPITGRSALHTGLDFQASQGTPILAAAGGVVVVQEFHPAYGNMVEIDHGNDLVTRYAHASSVTVKKGDLVRRGEEVALVGSTGRSTGAHLHFEVLVRGVPQDPQKFLTAGNTLAAQQMAGGSSKQPPRAEPVAAASGSKAARR